jgi:CheY-like chemotaxis protein
MDKVLIAEDDSIHMKRLTTVLGKFSNRFEVIPARDGQEAIDALQKQPVSLLVTDIQMPRVDGLMLLAHVNEFFPEIPCFVMTAYGTPQMRAKLPEDLLQFYQKPFDINDLAGDIIETLDRDKSSKALQGISVVSFLQIIEMEQSTCAFEIITKGKAPGVIHFNEGVLCDASCGDLHGEEAVMELIPRKVATFRFKFFPEKEVQRKINASLEELICRALEK